MPVCRIARVRAPEARRGAPLRGALRTPANTFGRAAVRANRRTRRRAQVTRTARRRTVRPDSPRGASPAFGGSAEEDDEASPPPSAGRLRRARRRVRASSMRFDARSVARRRPRRPRRSASRACRPSARLRRANALRIPRRAPAPSSLPLLFSHPLPYNAGAARLTRGRTRA